MAGFEMPSFIFGSGTDNPTQASLAKQRKIAEALRARATGAMPQTFWQGISGLTSVIGGNIADSRAAEIEAAGRKSGQAVIDALMANPDAGMPDYASALGNEWLDENQRAMAKALMAGEMQQSDPAYQLEQERLQLQIEALRNPPPPDRPTSVQEWEYGQENPDYAASRAPQPDPGYRTITDPAERAQFGIPETDTSIYQTGPNGQLDVVGSQGPAVTVNTGDNSNAFQKTIDEEAAKRMSEIITAGDGAALFMGDLRALTDIGRNIDTGQGAAIATALGPYAEMVGINIEGLGEMQAFDGIVSRMAPQMRVPGAGATSDFDAKQFLKSLPALARTPEGNQLINETFQGIQQHKMAAAEYARQASQGLLTWQEADKAIAALGDPYTAFKDTQAAAGPVAGVGGVNGIQEVPNFPGVTIEWIAP